MENFAKTYPELAKKAELKFGFECSKGWYDLLDGVFAIANQRVDIAKWRAALYNDPTIDADKIEACKAEVVQAIKELPSFLQIKEKFGTLRIYAGGASPELQGAIRLAEILSASTCEYCGCKGIKRRLRGWISTLCRNCAVEKYTEEAVLEYEEEEFQLTQKTLQSISNGDRDVSVDCLTTG